jgi:thioredoxin 1
MGKPIVLTEDTFEEEVLNAEEAVLVDFWAPWCGPCKMIGPIVEELAGELAGKMKVSKLNVDENGPVATKFGVFSIPTLIVFKGGEPVERLVGFMPKPKLLEKLNTHM